MKEPAPAPASIHGGIVVETSSIPLAQPGVATQMLSQMNGIPPLVADPRGEGAFRLLCNWTKMSYDDPIVYPGQPGLAHHHTFFGNTAIDANTTPDNIRSKGNASCRGGTINLSGYWVPSMIDTATNKPLVPRYLIVYYKTGYWPFMGDGSVMQPMPKGLRMITGDSTAQGPGDGEFSCFMANGQGNRPGTWGREIPANCDSTDAVRTRISFQQCWDGVNLDSPDHKSHMATPVAYNSPDSSRPFRCPATHPVVLPLVTFTVDYDIPAGSSSANLRLSSDTYDRSKPAGYSTHGDWMNGWDTTISEMWGVKCMRERRDCGSANLGDGRGTMEFQGN